MTAAEIPNADEPTNLAARLARAERREAQLQGEVADARAFQRATSEVMRLLSEHPGDVRVVLATVLPSIAELCDASIGMFHVLAADYVEVAAALAIDLPIGDRYPVAVPSVAEMESIRRRSPVLLDDWSGVEHADPVHVDAHRSVGRSVSTRWSRRSAGWACSPRCSPSRSNSRSSSTSSYRC